MKKCGVIAATALVSIISMPTGANAEPDLAGVWILYSAESFSQPALTKAGSDFKESYDFRKDDPALKCIPASWTRVYSNPNTPFEFTQSQGSVQIRYELFDVVRTVELVDVSGTFEHKPNNPDLPTLGDSVAWYDGEELLIHTKNYGNESRVLSTIRSWAGVPQSPLMVTLERYWLDEAGLKLEITHFDPVMYTEPLVVTYPFVLEPEFEVEYYGCEADAASVLTVPIEGED